MTGKSFDELTITDNFMFSKVMRNKELCKQFLEMVLRVKIREITFPQYERVIDIRYDAKSIRLDVWLEDDEHTVYNLEMQATSQDYLVKRTRFYQDLIDLDLLEKGQSYGELNRSVIIFIMYPIRWTRQEKGIA
ncbi:MAG: Rpn family recombination-promoting nuclease/putative transposase [Clostridium sp.]|nr:Rpn family recombination-promoting nuclease/putative transposase [Clostridium sp.]